MSGDDISPESLVFSPLSLHFRDDFDDRPSYAYRKFSVPITSSVSRTSYSRRRSRNSPLGTPVRPQRTSRRTSLPAIHFNETSVSTLHVEPGVLGQPNHALVAHLKKYTFGEPPIETTEKRPEEPPGHNVDHLHRPSESANDVHSLRSFQLAGGSIEDVRRRPDICPESLKSDININYILSEDIPVAVTDWDVYKRRISEGEPADFNGDSFVNHVQRVEPDSWTFMRDRRLSSFTEHEYASKPSDDARGERWWCEPLGRFIVCKKATAGQSRTSTEVLYNRLKIRRLPLDPSSSYTPGPPVLVHRHSKSDAFSIYRYFGEHTSKQRMDTSFTIILGTQRTLSAHYIFKRSKRSRQASNAEQSYSHKRTQTGQTDAMIIVAEAAGISRSSRPSNIGTRTNPQGRETPPPISIKTTGLPKLTAKLSPGSRGAPVSPISLPSKPLPETPSPQRKSFFRSLFGTFSFNKEPDTSRADRQDDTEDIIDCCRHVGLLPADMPRARYRTLAFSNLTSDTMCMLLPLWPEPAQSTGDNTDAIRPSRGSDRPNRTRSPKNPKYLLVYYPPISNSSPVVNAQQPRASGGKFDGTFCAYGRVLSYRDLRDAAIVLPERGLCVSFATPATPVQLHHSNFQDDPVLAIATKEQGIMICHYSFAELGLADNAGPTASEMGKAIAEMVWCGCITLMNFKS